MTTLFDHLSDNHLLKRVDRGDRASFETLFHRHYDRVYGLLFRLVGNRVEAEDLTQEVFLQLYQRPPRREDSNVGAWLYRVATNRGYNALRSRKRRWQRNLALVPDESDRPAGPESTVEANEAAHAAAEAVRVTLAQLSERQVRMLLLRQMGLSYAEIAEACEVAPGSVGTLLARAAEAFRRAYKALG